MKTAVKGQTVYFGLETIQLEEKWSKAFEREGIVGYLQSGFPRRLFSRFLTKRPPRATRQVEFADDTNVFAN